MRVHTHACPCGGSVLIKTPCMGARVLCSTRVSWLQSDLGSFSLCNLFQLYYIVKYVKQHALHLHLEKLPMSTAS